MVKHFLKHKWIYLIIGFAILTRIVCLGSFPNGTYTDEAYGAYISYGLLTEGICDRGYPYPVYFLAWGSGMSALYSYLGALLFKIFGVSTFVYRLPQALFSILGIVALYYLVKLLWNEKFARFAAFILCMAPIHLMMGRFGLDANMAPNMFLIAIAFLAYGIKKKSIHLIPAAIFLGLTLYCYALTWIMIPLFLVLLAAFLWKQIPRNKHTVIAVAILFVLAVPLLLFLAINLELMPEIRTAWFSIPKLTSFRGGELNFAAIKASLKDLYNILIVHQADGGEVFRYTSGAYYLFTTPFMVFGLLHHIYVIIKNIKAKENDTTVISLLWLVAAAFICIINQHLSMIHINMIHIPIIFYGAYGAYQLCTLLKNKWLYGLVLAVWVASFGLFTYEYVTVDNPVFFGEESYEAVERAKEIAGEEKTITFCGYATYKYPNLIWKELPKVSDYVANAKFDGNDAFQELIAYENYRYTSAVSEENADENSVYILDKKAMQSFDKLGFAIEKVNEKYAIATMPKEAGGALQKTPQFDKNNVPKATETIMILDEGLYQTKALAKGDVLEQTFYVNAPNVETISLAFGEGNRTNGQNTTLLVEVLVEDEVVMTQPLPLMACPQNTFLTFAIGQKDMEEKALTIRVTNTSEAESTTFSMLGTNCVYNFEEYSKGYRINGEQSVESILLNFGIESARNVHKDLAHVMWVVAGMAVIGTAVYVLWKRKCTSKENKQ